MAKAIGIPADTQPVFGNFVPPPLPVPPFSAASYVFVMNRFHIFNTRALDEDTDTVSFGVQIGNQMITPQVKKMGDVDNGDHPVNLQFGPILIKDPATRVVVNWAIVNDGHSSDTDLQTKLSSGLVGLATRVLGAASVWAAIAGAVINQILNIVFADCDGVVAAEQIDLTGGNLHAMTAATNGFTQEILYPGTDSDTGCGSNSLYSVTWSVLRIPPDPSHAIFTPPTR